MKINEGDWKILDFLRGGREARWKELEDSGMMAKSTLGKHLAELTMSKLIRKKISKTTNSPVYVLTARGKRLMETVRLGDVEGRRSSLKEFF